MLVDLFNEASYSPLCKGPDTNLLVLLLEADEFAEVHGGHIILFFPIYVRDTVRRLIHDEQTCAEERAREVEAFTCTTHQSLRQLRRPTGKHKEQGRIMSPRPEAFVREASPSLRGWELFQQEYATSRAVDRSQK